VPAQRARLGLRRPSIPPAAVETAVHQIFEVPPEPMYVLGTDLPEIRAAVDRDGDGWGGRPRSIGPLGGSRNGLPPGPPGPPAVVEPPVAVGPPVPGQAPVASPTADAAADAAAGSAARKRPPARRRPWWRRP
jgi:hypothetical protein